MRFGDVLGQQEFVRGDARPRAGRATTSRRFRQSATRSLRRDCLSRYRRMIRRRVVPQARPLQNLRAGPQSRTASQRPGRARPGRSRPQGRFRWSTMDRVDETTLADKRELCPLVAHMVVATASKSKLRPRRRPGQGTRSVSRTVDGSGHQPHTCSRWRCGRFASIRWATASKAEGRKDMAAEANRKAKKNGPLRVLGRWRRQYGGFARPRLRQDRGV